MIFSIFKKTFQASATLLIVGFGASSAHAATFMTPAVPYSTFGNNAMMNSSGGAGVSNLTFPKFNIPGATLNSVKLVFTGPTSGGSPGGVIQNIDGVGYGTNVGTTTVPNGSVFSISGIKAQVQLFFTGLTSPIAGPQIAVTPTSDTFTAAAGNRFHYFNVAGAYGGSSSPTSDALVLAAFQGSGNITTSSFKSVWSAVTSCTRPNGTSCNGSTSVDYSVAIGEQVDYDNPPSALLNNAWVSVMYDYTPPTPSSVPGPLPILGAGIAFGASRKARNRIKLAKNQSVSA